MARKNTKKDEINDGVELPGWPGYRTRANRSGLDPLDTRSEAAHMQGTFLRRIFTLQARTRNPYYLVLMFIFGVLPFTVVLILMMSGSPNLDASAIVPIIYLLLLIFVTGAVTINFVLSILEILKIIPPPKRPEKSRSKTIKKKQQKRRKDFR